MSRSGVLWAFCLEAMLDGVGVSVRRSSPGIEEVVAEDEEGGGEDSSEMRLLLLGCLELDEERGGWGAGERDLREPDGRGTDITCNSEGSIYKCKQHHCMCTLLLGAILMGEECVLS